MATNFPGALDSFTNPLSTDTQDDPPHADQHANANDAIEAVQAYLFSRTVVTTSSTAITAASSDHGKLVQLTATTPVDVELPAGVRVGVQIEYQATDTGLATFVLGAGASWRPAPTPSAIMLDTGSAVTAICVDTDTWMLVGRLA